MLSFTRLKTYTILCFVLLFSAEAYATALSLEPVEPFPKVGPMIRDLTSHSITVMAQGKVKKSKKDSMIHGRALLIELDDAGREVKTEPHTFNMLSENRGVGFLILNHLKPHQTYQLKLGYARGSYEGDHDQNIHDHYSWGKAHTLSFTTPALSPTNDFSFLTGSCRRIGRLTPIMDRKGDKIFAGMLQNIEDSKGRGIETNFIFFGGDQIYADALGELEITLPANEFHEYAALYEKAFSLPHFRKVTTTTGLPIYMQRDDHELWNNADGEEEAKRPQQSSDGHRAYALYQRPQGLETPHFWYTSHHGVDVFYTDTRSERFPSLQRMISEDQMNALKTWLIDEARRDRIKVVTTSVPIFLLSTPDTWDGFKAQKYELIDFIIKKNIKHVLFLSGDAHCQNDAQFKIYDQQGQDTGRSVVEVLVSGLYAISRGKADELKDKAEAMFNGEGYTLEATTPLAKTLKDNLFARISGNHETKEVKITVHNRKNQLLKEVSYILQ